MGWTAGTWFIELSSFTTLPVAAPHAASLLLHISWIQWGQLVWQEHISVELLFLGTVFVPLSARICMPWNVASQFWVNELLYAIFNGAVAITLIITHVVILVVLLIGGSKYLVVLVVAIFVLRHSYLKFVSAVWCIPWNKMTLPVLTSEIFLKSLP